MFNTFVFDILGLKDESDSRSNEKLTDDLMKIIIDLRQDAKNNKNWTASDKIRTELNTVGVTLKDKKDGVEWEIMNNDASREKTPYDPPREG